MNTGNVTYLAPETPREKPAPRPPSAKRGLSKAELKELKQVEALMRAAESRLGAARAGLEDPAVAAHASELVARQAAVDALRAEIDALFKRWEDLEQRR